MSFDSIFDQPDILPDPGAFEVVKYDATATRTDETWTVEAHDLPGDMSVRVEGRTWCEAEDAILARVPEALGVEPTTVTVSLGPADPDAAAAVRAVTDARINRAYAEQAERDAVRTAARLLVAQGWSCEDAAYALRLPDARMPELLSSAPENATRT